MRQINDIEKILTAGIVVLCLTVLGFFFITVFTSFIRPFFFDTSQSNGAVSVDKSLDEVVEYLREREDLTVSSSSATLNQELPSGLTAEIINGSAIPGAARTLGDQLASIGITVSQISNGEEVANTVIGFKSGALAYREDIMTKIGSKSAEIKFETLEEIYPFDIRIIIGK